MKESNYTHVIHPFPALYDADSKILILGSLPSVKSREQNFFYGHPRNRFWKMLAAVLGEKIPETIEGTSASESHCPVGYDLQLRHHRFKRQQY